MEYWMDRPRLNGGETVSMYLEPFTALIVDNGDGRMEPDDIPRIGKTIYVQDYKKAQSMQSTYKSTIMYKYVHTTIRYLEAMRHMKQVVCVFLEGTCNLYLFYPAQNHS